MIQSFHQLTRRQEVCGARTDTGLPSSGPSGRSLAEICSVAPIPYRIPRVCTLGYIPPPSQADGARSGEISARSRRSDAAQAAFPGPFRPTEPGPPRSPPGGDIPMRPKGPRVSSPGRIPGIRSAESQLPSQPQPIGTLKGCRRAIYPGVSNSQAFDADRARSARIRFTPIS
jgi:hypothetical protein